MVFFLALNNRYGNRYYSTTKGENMTLREWIAKNKYSYSQTAQKFGIININPATNIQRYAKGERIPHPKVMKKIFDGTKQQVQPNDFYEEYWQREKI